MKVFISILKVIGTIIVIIISFYSARLLYSFFPGVGTIDNENAVGIANTFIIFVTLIFIIATIIISFFIIYYTKHFSQTKELQLTENMGDILKIFSEKSDSRDRLISLIVGDKKINETINNKLASMNQELNKVIEEKNKKIEEMDTNINKLIKATKKNNDYLINYGIKFGHLIRKEPEDNDLKEIKESFESIKPKEK